MDNLIGQRMKEIREYKNLSQEAFGEMIGVKKTTISGYESGRRTPSEAVIKAVCREFNVSIAYLKEGLGDKFTDFPNTLLDELANEYHLNDIKKQIVKTFLELDEESQDVFVNFFEKIFGNKKGE
uniref:Helix-turn-helix domain protein n=1 Tax=Siphoviridae sp. ctGuJ10 TaxID=2825418 RepID=A0A8S5PT93_9CAUD|nr:MAG TPA: helix-turn-helix domain protein [Siphoviridae sp. ctGuJ10]